MVSTSISAVLREEVAKSGLTFSDLAKRVGMSPSNLIRFMHGEVGITLRSADRLAGILNLTLVEAEPRPVFYPKKRGTPVRKVDR